MVLIWASTMKSTNQPTNHLHLSVEKTVPFTYIYISGTKKYMPSFDFTGCRSSLRRLGYHTAQDLKIGPILQ